MLQESVRGRPTHFIVALCAGLVVIIGVPWITVVLPCALKLM